MKRRKNQKHGKTQHRPGSPPRRQRQRQPRTADEFFGQSDQFQQTWNRVVGVVAAMRSDGQSLSHAVRQSRLSRRTFLRLGRTAVRKASNGRYVARPHDTLLRVLVVPAADGTREVALTNSRDATIVAQYLNAVHRYLAGERTALDPFKRTRISLADGTRIPLLTDLPVLHRAAEAGVLSFESVYARR
jgi:hypothetical protein